MIDEQQLNDAFSAVIVSLMNNASDWTFSETRYSGGACIVHVKEYVLVYRAHRFWPPGQRGFLLQAAGLERWFPQKFRPTLDKAWEFFSERYHNDRFIETALKTSAPRFHKPTIPPLHPTPPPDRIIKEGGIAL